MLAATIEYGKPLSGTTGVGSTVDGNEERVISSGPMSDYTPGPQSEACLQATSAPPRLPVTVKLSEGEDGDPRRGHLKPAFKRS